MGDVKVTIRGDGLRKFADAIEKLGDKRANSGFARAINRTATVVSNEAGRALADQTGLPKTTGKRAYRRNVTRASPGSLTYTIRGSGGDVSLKYFKPRETEDGVSAAPHNSRGVYVGTFMRAGWWPKRVDKPGWNRQVFQRVGGSVSNYPSNQPIMKSGFQKVKSGVFIPLEMVKGEAAKAFLKSGDRLEKRIIHEITQMTKGVIS